MGKMGTCCQRNSCTKSVNASLAEYLSSDHARLDALLERALDDAAAYTEFRRGLLRHIAIEEKLLFPILKEIGEYRAGVAQLRSHHGALGALLVPRLSSEILAAIRDILTVHNAIEEGEDGMYAEAEKLADSAHANLYARALEVRDVPLSPAIDKLEDLGPVKRAIQRAGFDPSGYFRNDS